MAAPHYFQRYSQPENVSTNNTLLLLSRIHQRDPRLFRLVLGALLGESDHADVDVGPTFRQQTAERSSVPDGSISQQSFRILIETKRGGAFSEDQISRHLDAFADEQARVLILLAPEHASIAGSNKAKAKGVRIISRTFQDVINACGEAGARDEPELGEMLEDFEAYCFESELLSSAESRMMVVPVGDSLEENVRMRLYYAPYGYQPPGYIGLYRRKVIEYVGRVENIVQLVTANPWQLKNGSTVSADQKARILDAVGGASKFGWTIEKDHTFFLVERFVKTEFRKTSKGGLPGKRYFDLRSELGLKTGDPLPALEALAAVLRATSWE